MGGRIYDPTLGRFLQADPFIQAPKNSQNYNRYSYVLNNPLSMTDPSGYSFLSKAWKKVKKFAAPIVAVALVYFTGGAASWFATSWYGAATAGAISGAVGAAANGGNILTGALRGAVTAAAFYGVGSAFSQSNCASCYSGGELTAAATAGKVFVHAMTGGITSVLQGGKFGHGFMSAGIVQAAAPGINGIDQGSRFSLGRVATAAVVGGTVSKLSGGKFANGAATGAFSRLFNDEIHYAQSRRVAVQRARSVGLKTHRGLNHPDSLVRQNWQTNAEGLPLGTFVYEDGGEYAYSLRASPAAATGYGHHSYGGSGLIEASPTNVSDFIVVDGNGYHNDQHYLQVADVKLNATSVYIERPNYIKTYRSTSVHYVKKNGEWSVNE